MNWTQETAYNLRSDCKNYTVSKYGCAEGIRYEAWYKHRALQLKTRLKTADAAKSVCEAHQAKRHKREA